MPDLTDKQTFSDDDALEFHREPVPGKISMAPTKPMATQRDLSLAYSPGVAVPVLAIAEDPDRAYDYTSKGNLVAVISNGTAILGLGNLGHMASKPVMEGKAVLFKRFADVDSFDVEVKTTDPDEFVTVVKNIGDTWGGINLEDIKSPECFEIEAQLQDLLDIPVFHDDQHGTAIISTAGLINACHITGKKLEDIKVVLAGAGARDDAVRWHEGDIAAWAPEQPVDLIFTNAALQWVGDHDGLFPRLAGQLARRGVLAAQMPMAFETRHHTVMRAVAAEGPWAGVLQDVPTIAPLLPAETYYGRLAPACADIDIWSTTYLHALTGEDAVLNWMSGTALRPYLTALAGTPELRAGYLVALGEALRRAFPKRSDGVTLLPFPRLFLLARAW